MSLETGSTPVFWWPIVIKKGKGKADPVLKYHTMKTRKGVEVYVNMF
jgi:hypothetical protein